MTEQEQSAFKEQWDSVKYFTKELKDVNDRIGKLSRWDKNGSHTQAINNALDDRTKIRKALTDKLQGKTFEEWQTIARKLSALNSRLKKAHETVKRIEDQMKLLTP